MLRGASHNATRLVLIDPCRSRGYSLFLISEQFAFVHLKNVKTPTLILQGDADLVDPPGQRQELYRGLKRYGIETEFVVYPCEPTALTRRSTLDRLNRILAWCNEHFESN